MTIKQFDDITRAMKEIATKEPNLPEDAAWDIFIALIASVSEPDHYITFAPQQEN